MQTPHRPSPILLANTFEINSRLNTMYENFEKTFITKQGCFLRKSQNQSIANNTLTAVTWDVFEVNENTSMLSTVSNSRITALEKGLYDVTYTAAFASGAGNKRLSYFIKNGLGSSTLQRYAIIQVSPVTLNETVITGSYPIFLDKNDYIELIVLQDSGAALNLIGKAAIETSITIRQRF